jgi:catechol 2,3-dioxygenase-like lactoylglutathione lyase family enzyme
MIKRMDHFTVVTDQLKATLDFYTDLLGFVDGPRPDFGVPGHWLYIDERPVLHLIEVATMPAVRRGAIDHLAYWAEGFLETVERLKALDLPYRIIRTPRPFSSWQLFFDDPNGAEVELDFDASETAPEDWKDHARALPR